MAQPRRTCPGNTTPGLASEQGLGDHGPACSRGLGTPPLGCGVHPGSGCRVVCEPNKEKPQGLQLGPQVCACLCVRACASVLRTWVLCGGLGPASVRGRGLPGHKCPKAPPPGGALEKLAGAHHVAVGALAQASWRGLGSTRRGRPCSRAAGGRADRRAGQPRGACAPPRTMLPWLGPWGTGRGEAAGEPGPSTAGDHGSGGGGDGSSGEETTEEPGLPAQGR